MDKLHKALAEILFATGAVCESGLVAEDQIQKLIEHTKQFVAEVSRPAAASGMDPERWKELQKQQYEFHNLTNSPAFVDKLTPEQRSEINELIHSLPWGGEPIDWVHGPANKVLNPLQKLATPAVAPPTGAPQTFKPPAHLDIPAPPKHDGPKKPDC